MRKIPSQRFASLSSPIHISVELPSSFHTATDIPPHPLIQCVFNAKILHPESTLENRGAKRKRGKSQTKTPKNLIVKPT